MTRRPPGLRPVDEAPSPCSAVLSRRGFCAGTVGLLGLSACGGDAERISVGALDGGTVEDFARSGDGAQINNSPEDLAGTGPHDLSTTSQPTPDMAEATGASCTGTVSGGAETAITATSPKYISSKKVWVCRDAGGLYAMSSACTHSGCKVTLASTEWYCSCHGATFDLNGQNPTEPANSPLKHYAMCVDGTGTVQVDTSTVVPYTTRS